MIASSSAAGRAARLLGSAACVLSLGAAALGCAPGSSGKVSMVKTAQAVAEDAETAASIASLAMQASLNVVDGANYLPVTGPAISTTGTAAAAGTVELDFGGGLTVNGASVAGIAAGDFDVSGNDVTLTVDFTDVEIDGARVTGTYVVVAVRSGDTSTGSITGTVTVQKSKDTTTVAQSMTYTLSGAGGTAVYAGNSTVTSSKRGTWTVTYTSVGANLATSQALNVGTLELVRTSGGSAVTAIMLFTGTNVGTITVTPPGTVALFTL